MRFRFPTVFKVLVRGYLVIAFIILVSLTGLIKDLSIIIFAVTIVSISMLFGIGFLLMSPLRPVRKSNCDIPNTVLVFVKGALVLYFISLLGNFGTLPKEITALLMTGVAFVLVMFGVVSYVFEVFERAAPVKPRSDRAKELLAMRRYKVIQAKQRNG